MTTHTNNGDVITPTFLSPWGNFGGFEAAGYWKDPSGHVHLTGLVAAFIAPPSNIFTLPVGFRPAGPQLFAVLANGAIGRVDIGTRGAGIVSLEIGNATYVQLFGITFLAQA